jgi:hypothetical protein
MKYKLFCGCGHIIEFVEHPIQEGHYLGKCKFCKLLHELISTPVNNINKGGDDESKISDKQAANSDRVPGKGSIQ